MYSQILKDGKLTDLEILKWIHDRLITVHHENENYDYMHRLRRAIDRIEEINNLAQYL